MYKIKFLFNNLMSSNNNGLYKCKWKKSFVSKDNLRQHIKHTIDATDWKTHGIIDDLEI